MNVEKLRKARGWSRYRLGRVSGVSDMVLRNLERGESNPSWETAVALANALCVSLDELAGRTVPIFDETCENQPCQRNPRPFSLYRRNAKKKPRQQPKKSTAPEVS